jgi:hypothetical protein
MNLLETFDELIGSWSDVFPQTRTFQRARRLAFGLLVSVRMHLTSNAICATGRQFVDWTADYRAKQSSRHTPEHVAWPYRVCSRSPWDAHRLFDPIFDHLPQLLTSPSAPVRMALDDTLCKKSSARIPGVSMGQATCSGVCLDGCFARWGGIRCRRRSTSIFFTDCGLSRLRFW